MDPRTGRRQRLRKEELKLVRTWAEKQARELEAEWIMTRIGFEGTNAPDSGVGSVTESAEGSRGLTT